MISCILFWIFTSSSLLISCTPSTTSPGCLSVCGIICSRQTTAPFSCIVRRVEFRPTVLAIVFVVTFVKKLAASQETHILGIYSKSIPFTSSIVRFFFAYRT
ncbi:hypothetical protein GGR55DRAFT_206720 [Xylaria sp. FL0064]|nr:hypothetical protein GGR55DRAFT_206720 [Xylaria sp. FL0064]